MKERTITIKLKVPETELHQFNGVSDPVRVSTIASKLKANAEITIPKPLERKCLNCNKPIVWSGIGTERKFCSGRCKTAYWRRLKRDVTET